MRFRSLLRSGALLLVAQVFATASQFAYSWYTSRALSESAFGALGSLLSIFMIGTLPLSTLMLQVTYNVARFRLRGEHDALEAYLLGRARLFAAIGLFVLVIGSALTPLVCTYLHIESPWPVLLLWLSLFCALLARVPYGTFQGLQQFGWLGLFMGVPPFLRLIMAVVFPKTLTWFMLAGAAAAVLEITFGYLVIFRKGGLEVERSDSSHMPEDNLAFWFTFGGMACLAVMTNVDVLIIRNNFPEAGSGYYSLITAISKGLIFFPLSIAYVLFPSVSEQSMLRKDPRLLLLKSLAVTAVLVLTCCVPCVFFPELIIGLFDAEKYAQAVPLLRIVGLAAVPLALVNILVHHLLATLDKLLLWFGLPLAAGHVVFLSVFGTSPYNMVIGTAISGSLVAVTFAFLALRQGNHITSLEP